MRPITKQIKKKAFAKINLSLDIIGKRPDGYHDIRTVMVPVSIYDTITIKRIDKRNYLKVISNMTNHITDERNIVTKTARFMIERYGIEQGLFIDVNKRTPIAAGMGGGSSDSANVILGINELLSLNLSYDEMHMIATGMGADVPFFLDNKTQLAEGIGETLTPISPKFPVRMYLLVVRPNIFISTADVFKELRLDSIIHPNVDDMVAQIKEGNKHGICSALGNSLEQVTASTHPVIYEIKNELIRAGASGALMSGSGPTVFGIFMARNAARTAQGIISTKFDCLRFLKIATIDL